MWRFVVIACFFFCAPWAATAGSSPLSKRPITLAPETWINTITQAQFCGEKVPLDRPAIRERLEKELLLMLWDRPQVILWLKRSGRYFPEIEHLLAIHGMPPDLKYIAVIESALRPHVGSPKAAMGFWQFLKTTGQKYGLVINREIDQRRDITASTLAAIKYFKQLHRDFGSWTLSAAAYNMGEKGLLTEIIAQENHDYYRLYLPLETQRFILRGVVAKILFENPEKYGFHLQPEDLYAPVKYQTVTTEYDFRVPIHLIARAATTNFKMIKDLNPHIRGHFFSAGKHVFKVPFKTTQGFAERLQTLMKSWRLSQREHQYVVQKGDSLSAIAQRFGLPIQTLLIWNRLNIGRPIHPGDELTIIPLKK